jgi:hypothetical protein
MVSHVHPSRKGACWRNRRVSGPGHDRTARQVPFVPCTRCGPTGPNYGAIDAPQIPVQEAASIETALQRLEDAVERTVFTIASEPVIHGLPGAIALGQVVPGCTAAQPPQHAVEDGPVLLPLAASNLQERQAMRPPARRELRDLIDVSPTIPSHAPPTLSSGDSRDQARTSGRAVDPVSLCHAHFFSYPTVNQIFLRI